MTDQVTSVPVINDDEVKRIRNSDYNALWDQVSQARERAVLINRACADKDNPEATVSFENATKHAEFKGMSAGDIKDEAGKLRDWLNVAGPELDAKYEHRELSRAAGRSMPNREHEAKDYQEDQIRAVSPDKALNYFVDRDPNVSEGQVDQALEALARGEHGSVKFDNVKALDFLNTMTTTTSTVSGHTFTRDIQVDTPRSPRDVVILHENELVVTPTIRREICGVGNTLTFLRETALTDTADQENSRNIAGVGENRATPEQEFQAGDEDVTVVKRGVELGVTEEMLLFIPQARNFINNRLNRLVARDIEKQIIQGTGGDSGSGKEMTGLLNQTGIGTTAAQDHKAVTATPHIEHIADALGTYRTSAKVAPSYVITPYAIRVEMMKTRTATGEYFWGNAITGSGNLIWGVPYMTSEFLTANTGMILNRNDVFLLVKDGIKMEYGTSGTDFSDGVRRIRIVYFANVGAERPKSIHKITFGTTE